MSNTPVFSSIQQNIQSAAKFIAVGELVAFPTETVYGVGADARQEKAVEKIFVAKGRPADHPLIVHLAGSTAVSHWAEKIPAYAFDLMEAFWPGPLTLILKKKKHVLNQVTGGQNTVGLRVPGHPIALELLRNLAALQDEGAGIAAPSANRFGHISPTSAIHVDEELGEHLAMILDGSACHLGIESTIVDCSGKKPLILRPGHLNAEHLGLVLSVSPETLFATRENMPRVSGALPAHYSPSIPLFLVDGADWATRLAAERAPLALISFQAPCAGIAHIWHPMPREANAYARSLYAALRDMEKTRLPAILLETPPEGSAWLAIHDRLQRATAGSKKT